MLPPPNTSLTARAVGLAPVARSWSATALTSSCVITDSRPMTNSYATWLVTLRYCIGSSCCLPLRKSSDTLDISAFSSKALSKAWLVCCASRLRLPWAAGLGPGSVSNTLCGAGTGRGFPCCNSGWHGRPAVVHSVRPNGPWPGFQRCFWFFVEKSPAPSGCFL